MTIQEAMARADFNHPYHEVAEFTIASEVGTNTVNLEIGTDNILVEDVIITGRDAAGVRLDDNQAAMEAFTMEMSNDKVNYQGTNPPDIDSFNKGKGIHRFILNKSANLKMKITALGTSGAAVLTYPVAIRVNFKGYVIKEG
jgi:hypothetical protein